MNIRFYNARILTMEDDKPIIEGQVWVSGNRILYVGDDEGAKSAISVPISDMKWDREIDCEKNLLMPGFKDCHTHSGMTCLRSFADDMPLEDWLNKQIFPMEAKLTPEDIYEFTRLAALEYLSCGITSVMDMYLTPDSIADAFDDMGMRCVQTGGTNNFSQSVKLLDQWYHTLNEKSELQSFVPGFHAVYTCSNELMEEIAGLANRLQTPIYVHACETSFEVEECKKNHDNMSPIQYLDSIGMFNYGGGVYHAVYLSEEDIEIIKKRNLYVITNPGSNVKLASGIAPINQLLKEGVKIAIGTDGPASNNCLDMFREMFLVTGLSKLREMDASSVDAVDVLKMATVNGSEALGLSDTRFLSRGMLADMIMIDLRQPNMQPIINIKKNLVYSGSKSNIKMTMINGEILYMDGEFFTKTSANEIYDICNKRFIDLKNR